MFPAKLATDRLRFERLSTETVDPVKYYEHCSEHEPDIETVTEFLPWNPHQTIDQTISYLESLESKWEKRERAEYVIRPANGQDGAGEVAGAAGIILNWDADLGIFAIWLRKPFWGRGYSGERADAFLRLAFDYLDLSMVAIPIVDENERSYRAVEKYVDRYGGQYEGLLRNHTGRYDEPKNHHRFTISHKEYKNAVEDGVPTRVTTPESDIDTHW